MVAETFKGMGASPGTKEHTKERHEIPICLEDDHQVYSFANLHYNDLIIGGTIDPQRILEAYERHMKEESMVLERHYAAIALLEGRPFGTAQPGDEWETWKGAKADEKVMGSWAQRRHKEKANLEYIQRQRKNDLVWKINELHARVSSGKEAQKTPSKR